MQPNQVFHYKFTIPDAAAASNKGNNRFYLGYYVPGAGEPDFTFYVAVFGMRNSTNCSQWGDGWGRRRRLGGGDDHAHNTAPTTPITAPDSGVITPHRITSSGTAWLMDSNDIPERVSGKNDGHDHDHDGQFNYHKAADTLTFIASPATNRPNKVRESGGCGERGVRESLGCGELGVRESGGCGELVLFTVLGTPPFLRCAGVKYHVSRTTYSRTTSLPLHATPPILSLHCHTRPSLLPPV